MLLGSFASNVPLVKRSGSSALKDMESVLILSLEIVFAGRQDDTFTYRNIQPSSSSTHSAIFRFAPEDESSHHAGRTDWSQGLENPQVVMRSRRESLQRHPHQPKPSFHEPSFLSFSSGRDCS
jgi:hypothetical protein